eukprot:4856675-Lingulodinium_polyedra.AAC.1
MEPGTLTIPTRPPTPKTRAASRMEYATEAKRKNCTSRRNSLSWWADEATGHTMGPTVANS